MKAHEKELSLNKVWYLQLFAYIVNLGAAIYSKMAIFLNSTARDFFSFFNTNVLGFLNILSFGAISLGWLGFFKHIYDHWNKEKDKNYWADLITTLLSNVLITSFIIIGATASGATFYVLAVAIGINALFCLVKVCQNIYEGFFNNENSPQEQKEYRWACLRHLLALVVNTLALVLTVHLGIFLLAEASKISMGDFSAIQAVVDLYKSMESLVWAFLGVTATAVVVGQYKAFSVSANYQPDKNRDPGRNAQPHEQADDKGMEHDESKETPNWRKSSDASYASNHDITSFANEAVHDVRVRITKNTITFEPPLQTLCRS